MKIDLTEHERADILCALQAQSEWYDECLRKEYTEITARWKKKTDELIKKINGIGSIWRK